MRRGFTLVELMVVVGILMVLTGIGVVNISRFSARDNVNSARSEVVSAIKLARNYAVTMQTPKDWGNQLDYVALVVDSTGMISIFPVNVVVGVGPSFYAKAAGSKDVLIGPVNFGEMLFSVPEGKLLQLDTLKYPLGAVPRTASDTVQVFIKSQQSSGVGVGDTQVINVWNSGVLDEENSAVGIKPTGVWGGMPTGLIVNTPVPTSVPAATSTPILPTNTPRATSTPTLTPTRTPTATNTPVPTATSVPVPTASCDPSTIPGCPWGGAEPCCINGQWNCCQN